MFLFLLILITTVLAATAAYFSVVGLAALFSFHFWGVVVMGSALEAGKLVTTSYLYKFWKEIGFIRKYLMAGMVLLLMVLTSLGIFGYLMQGFQEGNSNREVSSIKLETNQKELSRVESRLKDIETQIANLPKSSVNGRVKLEKTYREEASVLKNRLFELTKQQTEIKVTSLESDTHLGPIVYVAKELGVDAPKAATYLVLLIVVIFDPLTVLLTLSINHVLNERSGRQQDVRVTEPGKPRRRLRGVRRGIPSAAHTPINEEQSQGSAGEEQNKKDEEEPVLTEVVTPQRRVVAADSGRLIYED